MNELQVIKAKPAVIEFNHEQMEKELDESLKKYKGLVLSEDNITEGRRTLAELRKGKKAINRFRIDTKRELMQPVTNFEDKCKQLDAKFDAVIEPLDAQVKEFVQRQRDEKREKILEIIDEVIEEQGIEEKYHDEFEIIDTDFAQNRSLRAIKESYEMKAQHIIIKQEKDKADRQVIKTTVDLANERHNVNLTTEPYIRLLEFEEVETIKQQILDHAQKEVDRRLEQERIEKEKEEQARIEQERIKKEKEIERHLEQEQQKEKVEEKTAEEEKEREEFPFAAYPFIEDPFANEPVFIDRSYEVTGTEEQLEALQEYMALNNLEWSVLT